MAQRYESRARSTHFWGLIIDCYQFVNVVIKDIFVKESETDRERNLQNWTLIRQKVFDMFLLFWNWQGMLQRSTSRSRMRPLLYAISMILNYSHYMISYGEWLKRWPHEVKGETMKHLGKKNFNSHCSANPLIII